MWHCEELANIRPASLAVGIVYLVELLSAERMQLGNVFMLSGLCA